MAKDDDFFKVEFTGETHYVEEELYVDENIVKNRALIRMDMNIVQFPIFSKNAKRKKNEVITYYFNKNKDIYITIKPSSGDLIPGESEERIFIALMKIMKEKGMDQEFIVTAKEIKKAAKIHASHYIKEIKKSLLRLSSTNYIFKNTLYSNETGGILKTEISTPILTFKALELSLKENKKVRDNLKDNRIKEVYKIKISDYFYRNIVKRGYLVYDSNILLDINGGIARTLYMLLEKIRFDNLYIRESIFALIRKIPLKYERKSLSVTIKTLEKALEELKTKKLIKNFSFIKDTTWLEADIEVFFDEEHNFSKKERFKADNDELKKIYNVLAISHTEKNIEKLKTKELITETTIKELIELLPTKAKILKTMEKTIRNSIDIYGYTKVKQSILYLKSQKELKSPRAYFLKILENNWAKDIILKETEELKIQVLQENEIQENMDFTDAEIYYNNLDEIEKQIIEDKVYKEYIKKCGQETKAQKIAFKQAKENLIYTYITDNNLKKISKFKEKQKNEVSFEERVLKDRKIFIDYIGESIDMYKLGFNLSEEAGEKIKKEIFFALIGEFILKTLTFEKLNNTIAEKLS